MCLGACPPADRRPHGASIRALGRALAETIVGTGLGGALGVQFMGRGWLIGALAGFSLATIGLRVLAKRARATGPNRPQNPQPDARTQPTRAPEWAPLGR